MKIKSENIESFKTKITALIMNLADAPLVAFYAILPFFLRKDLHIGVFQLSFFIMLRPVLSSFSFFWGIGLNYTNNPKLLRNNIFAWTIARVPFLLFPFVNNFYYFLFAAAIYQLFHKAGFSAWTEIIKRNVKKDNDRHSLFSTYTVFVFIENILLGLFLGKFLDKSEFNWKIIFFFVALLSLSSLFFQMKIKVQSDNSKNIVKRQKFLTPFKDIIELLKTDSDFAKFQIVFMIGGFALILIIPAFYIFSNDYLNLTNQDMTYARLISMGIGYSGTSFLWKKFITKKSINSLMIWVVAGFAIYIFFLLFAQLHISFLYMAFFFYGIAQAGSVFLWNFSSIAFSKNKNTILYTSTNLILLLLRGLIAPILGSFLCNAFGALVVFYIGLLILFYGIYKAYRLNKETYVIQKDPN
jgi:hypothetical protein